MLIKTAEEIVQIKRGGRILGRILAELVKMCQPGVSTLSIDQAAEKMMVKAGGRPSFKGYKNKPTDKPFPTTICASINQELVHACAKENVFLKDGDIFSIDIGMEYPLDSPKSKVQSPKFGYFTDTALTIPIGKIPEKTRELLRVTKEALESGIRAAMPGNTVADIGRAIEKYVNSQGKYGIIRDLVGHGVGHEVHEEPRVPNFYEKRSESWKLKPGMVIAIEPMISLGDYRVKTAPDGWAIETADGSLCAHFEHTVIITENGNTVVTRHPHEQNESSECKI